MSAGAGHTCGVLTDQSLSCWGSNANGRLGDGTTMPRLVPTHEVTHGAWTQVAAGQAHTCGILSNHWLYCWGFGQPGAVGVPRLVGRDYGDGIEPLPGWVSVSVGSSTEALRNP